MLWLGEVKVHFFFLSEQNKLLYSAWHFFPFSVKRNFCVAAQSISGNMLDYQWKNPIVSRLKIRGTKKKEKKRRENVNTWYRISRFSTFSHFSLYRPKDRLIAITYFFQNNYSLSALLTVPKQFEELTPWNIYSSVKKKGKTSNGGMAGVFRKALNKDGWEVRIHDLLMKVGKGEGMCTGGLA